MGEPIVFPETYRNCFKIPHYICSIIICTVVYIIAVVGFLLTVCAPKFVDDVYDVGGYPTKIIVCGCIMSILLALFNSFLAFGVAKEWALFLLVWVIVSIIMWNLHFILIITSFVFVFNHKPERQYDDIISISLLFFLQVIWMFAIIMVGRHWYAICEEIYQQEYGQAAPRGISRRIYTMSNRSRVSHYSTRTPQILHRIDRDHRPR